LPETSRLTTVEIMDRLGQFDGPPEQFVLYLLAVQCQVAQARCGALLRAGAQGKPEVLAVFPQLEQGAPSPVWLALCVEAAPETFSTGKTTIKSILGSDSLYGQPAERHLILVPLKRGPAVWGVAAYLLETTSAAALAERCERLEITVSLISLYEMRLTLVRRQADLRRMRLAMETLAAVNVPERFTGAAMAMCNEVAARWQCDRVGLGFLKGRYVQLKGLSHTEKFSRKMRLVQDIEAAMEECLDQDVEVAVPADPEATFVSRAARELSMRHGPTCVLSLPLRRGGDVVAVLTCERPPDRPFAPEDVESLRLACDLCTARLANLYEHDRWFGARLIAAGRRGLALAVGPKHTWLKVAAVAALVAILYVCFAKGEYRAEAPFVLQASERLVIPAPFDGEIATVSVRPGHELKKGETVLMTLDTALIDLRIAAAKYEMVDYQKQAAAAMRDGKTAEEQMAQAQVDKTQAQIKLLEYQKRKATIISPITGTVLTGDLKQNIGAAVKQGDVLFEVAPLQSLEAELYVPEDQIADVKENQEGELATASYPGIRVPFTVERISPVAEVVKERNVFKVRVKLSRVEPWMRPGLEGVAKVDLGRANYAWIWTHRMVKWIQMTFWL
jgi:biotin carboxyl carrier protein